METQKEHPIRIPDTEELSTIFRVALKIGIDTKGKLLQKYNETYGTDQSKWPIECCKRGAIIYTERGELRKYLKQLSPGFEFVRIDSYDGKAFNISFTELDIYIFSIRYEIYQNVATYLKKTLGWPIYCNVDLD